MYFTICVKWADYLFSLDLTYISSFDEDMRENGFYVDSEEST